MDRDGGSPSKQRRLGLVSVRFRDGFAYFNGSEPLEVAATTNVDRFPDWRKVVPEAYGSNYICQEFVPQYYSENIDFVFGDGQWHNYTMMAGLYVYNGKFAGVFSRAALEGEIIDYINNERRQVTYVLN